MKKIFSILMIGLLLACASLISCSNGSDSGSGGNSGSSGGNGNSSNNSHSILDNTNWKSTEVVTLGEQTGKLRVYFLETSDENKITITIVTEGFTFGMDVGSGKYTYDNSTIHITNLELAGINGTYTYDAQVTNDTFIIPHTITQLSYDLHFTKETTN